MTECCIMLKDLMRCGMPGILATSRLWRPFTVPVRAVYGNIDGQDVRAAFPLHQRFFCEGIDVWITHIWVYSRCYYPRLNDALKADFPKLFIYGHSHVLKVMFDKSLGVLHMNPGAAGIYDFQKVRTMLRFSVEGGCVSNLEVIELDRRS